MLANTGPSGPQASPRAYMLFFSYVECIELWVLEESLLP